MRLTERDAFNNIFVHTDRLPSVGFVGMSQAANIREGGNLLWGMKEGPGLNGDPFAKFRTSGVFDGSRRWHEHSWTADVRMADPKFVRLPADLRPKIDSPAVDAGVPVPAAWPDPLRASDAGPPDVGTVQVGVEPWRIGVDGRLSVFGE